MGKLSTSDKLSVRCLHNKAQSSTLGALQYKWGFSMSNVFITSLPQLAVLEFTGRQAAELLQGQLTADIYQVNNQQATPASLCNAQGRVISNFEVICLGREKLGLIFPLANLEVVEEHFSKFLPFYQVEVKNLTTSYQLLGLSGKDVPALITSLLGVWPKQDYLQGLVEQGLILHLPGPLARALLLLNKNHSGLNALVDKLTNLAVPAAEDCWNLLDIKTGRAQITDKVSSGYLPQMLNYPAIGAVSFNKGCYLGQEIVARAEFRGKVKKRLYRLNIPADNFSLPAKVYDEEGKPQGELINLAADAKGAYEALAVINTQAMANNNNLYADADQKQKLIVLNLPYSAEERLELYPKKS